MGLTRREAIKMGVAIGGLSPLGWTGVAFAQENDVCATTLIKQGRDCPTPEQTHYPFSPSLKKFHLELVIPAELAKESNPDKNTDYYTIRIQSGQKRCAAKLEDGTDITLVTNFWGYNGIFPGPTIKQGVERRACVRFINELPEVEPIVPPASDGDCFRRPRSPQNLKPNELPKQYNDMVIHLHGMNSKPYYDGYAMDIIPPQYYKDYVYPNDEPGTFWYHDHAMDRTAENVQRGLAGMYLVVDQARDQKLGLPMGAYDVPLMLQDRAYALAATVKQDAQGREITEAIQDNVYYDRCPFDSHGHNSFYGDVICVNGVPFPYMKVEKRKYRFRILNASGSRHYRLALSQPNKPNTVGGTITVIGNDQDLLPYSVPIVTNCRALSVGMAERYDVIIDFSKCASGDCLYLRNVGSTGMRDNDDRVGTIMEFRVKVMDAVKEPELPLVLNQKFKVLSPATLPPGTPITTRRWRFEQGGGYWVINGKTWNDARIDAKPAYEGYEIWEFINPGSGWIHPVHPHLIKFQILSRNGQKPPCHQRGWKDVVMVHEFETVRVMMRFKPHPGKYMMHCHNLVHEDHAMMTQFEVIQKDDAGNAILNESPCSRRAKPISEMTAMNCTEQHNRKEDEGGSPQPCETKPACLG